MISARRSQLQVTTAEAKAEAKAFDHPGLALTRYLPQQDDPASKADLLKAVAASPPNAAYRLAFTRWKEVLKALGCTTVELPVRDRLLVGLGAESVLETAITLHHTYGMPYIPGSALKGLARHYFRQLVESRPDAERMKQHEDILFGDPQSAGYITYFDAWYVPKSGECPLCRDVMTVHHRNYYSSKGENPPTDFDDPNPIGFLSARGTYLLAVKGEYPEWTAFALELLKQALADYGAGGKTSSGYGRIDVKEAAGHQEIKAGAAPATPDPPISVLIRSLQAMRNVKADIDGFSNRWMQLADGAEKLEAARIMQRHLEKAGCLKDEKWRAKPWVQAILSYVSEHAGSN